MSGYVVAGYTVTVGGIVAYVLWVLGRERSLRRDVSQDTR